MKKCHVCCRQSPTGTCYLTFFQYLTRTCSGRWALVAEILSRKQAQPWQDRSWPSWACWSLMWDYEATQKGHLLETYKVDPIYPLKGPRLSESAEKQPISSFKSRRVYFADTSRRLEIAGLSLGMKKDYSYSRWWQGWDGGHQVLCVTKRICGCQQTVGIWMLATVILEAEAHTQLSSPPALLKVYSLVNNIGSCKFTPT